VRVVLLSVDDEFAGLMQRDLYARHPEWIVGSVISTRQIYKKNALTGAAFIIQKSGLYYFMQMVRMKLLRRLISGRPPEPSTLARRHNVEIFRTANINTPDSVSRLRYWNPDVVISTNFSHYIGQSARSVARFGTWNLHKSYLPHYRGMAPNFFALLEGASSVGATLHVVDATFDTGPILTQINLPVEHGDTVYTLNRKTAECGGAMLAAFLENANLEQLQPTPQENGDWRNYTYPNKAEIALFRRKGLAFYKRKAGR
jgi:folate-dependent phosphoribosylglycinamide formyltransferase PurN